MSLIQFYRTAIKNLTGAPKNQYYLGVGWNAFPKFHADVELKGVGGLFVAEDIDNQNYAIVNMRLSYQLIKQLQISLNFNNITNTQYVINRGYNMPGFNIMGGFKLTI